MISDPSSISRPRAKRRVALVLAALALMWMVLGPSCATAFDPPSKVNALRVFSIDPSQSYGLPGETVTFKLHFSDSLDRTESRPIQVTWLGGCFDPEGDAYFGCYASLADTLKKVAGGGLPPDGLIAQGPDLDTFSITLPPDIITRRPRPAAGAYSGTAFVFFAACAGTVKPIAQEGTSDAGSFPLGCFADDGTRLGTDSFVAGYTEVYAFEDGRKNQTPCISDLTFDGSPVSDDFRCIPSVPACDVSDAQRKQTGCAASSAYKSCEKHKVNVIVPTAQSAPTERCPTVGAVDEDVGRDDKGNQLHEVVWVSYFADGGDFADDTRLISDATSGYLNDTQGTTWVPPAEPGTYNIWVVVRDSRGASSTFQRLVNVVANSASDATSGGGGACAMSGSNDVSSSGSADASSSDASASDASASSDASSSASSDASSSDASSSATGN